MPAMPGAAAVVSMLGRRAVPRSAGGGVVSPDSLPSTRLMRLLSQADLSQYRTTQMIAIVADMQAMEREIFELKRKMQNGRNAQ